MALDATVAGATANSYLTVAAADALAAADLGRQAAGWLAALTATKEAALQRATREIDGNFPISGLWVRYDADQALLFPRPQDATGAPLAPYIHPNVEQATYHQAAYLVANASLIDDAAARRARGLFSFSDSEGGGSVALDPAFGLLAPQAMAFLTALRAGGKGTLSSVQIASADSYPYGYPSTRVLP